MSEYVEMSTEELTAFYSILEQMNANLEEINGNLQGDSTDDVSISQDDEQTTDQNTTSDSEILTELEQLQFISDQIQTGQDSFSVFSEDLRTQIDKVADSSSQSDISDESLDAIVTEIQISNQRINEIESRSILYGDVIIPLILVVFVGWWVIRQFI